MALRNLFVSMNNTIKYTVKIGDFGLAKPLGDSNVVVSSTNVIFVVSLDLTHLQNIPMKWSAIEVIEEGKYSKSSDVWSFGVVLW